VSPRALITGGGGQLASDLEDCLSPVAQVSALSRGELDVTDDEAVARAIERCGPDTVFNCAAFHNVDACERDEGRAFAVNARAVKRLAERCAERGAKLVHVSTNYVFDGRREEPYVEIDAPNPRSVYAISKLAGEHAALSYAPGALVVRTGGLYGMHGSASKGGNFVSRMVAAARQGGSIAMVADQRLNPTYTADLARAMIDAAGQDARGLIHLTNSDACSWYEFTEAILRLAAIDVPIEPVPTRRAPRRAERPLNGALASSRADATGRRPLRPWRDALRGYMDRAGLLAEAVPQ
jgi:dTDP-4-dehydrorhamnose reductase